MVLAIQKTIREVKAGKLAARFRKSSTASKTQFVAKQPAHRNCWTPDSPMLCAPGRVAVSWHSRSQLNYSARATQVSHGTGSPPPPPPGPLAACTAAWVDAVGSTE